MPNTPLPPCCDEIASLFSELQKQNFLLDEEVKAHAAKAADADEDLREAQASTSPEDPDAVRRLVDANVRAQLFRNCGADLDRRRADLVQSAAGQIRVLCERLHTEAASAALKDKQAMLSFLAPRLAIQPVELSQVVDGGPFRTALKTNIGRAYDTLAAEVGQIKARVGSGMEPFAAWGKLHRFWQQFSDVRNDPAKTFNSAA